MKKEKENETELVKYLNLQTNHGYEKSNPASEDEDQEHEEDEEVGRTAFIFVFK